MQTSAHTLHRQACRQELMLSVSLHYVLGRLALTRSSLDFVCFRAEKEHLHVFYNALQSAVTSIPTWTTIEQMLKAMHAILKCRGFRERFQEKCMTGATPRQRAMLNYYQGAKVDWKWEYLSRLLDPLVRVWPLLFNSWNKAKLDGAFKDDEMRTATISPAVLDLVDVMLTKTPLICDTTLCLWKMKRLFFIKAIKRTGGGLRFHLFQMVIIN